MELFYFGDPAKQLFGVYHASQSQQKSSIGLVMCYPIWHEYHYYHRAYIILAKALSLAGIDVLRFDYYGSGDSSGDDSECSMTQWCRDISTAVKELKYGCGLKKICLLGSRFGGSLAMRVGSESGEIDGIVLWDPVVGGREYLRDLRRNYHKFLRFQLAKQPDMKCDVFGYNVTEPVYNEIESTNILEFRQKPADNVLLIESMLTKHGKQLANCMHSSNICLSCKHVPDNEPWNRDSGPATSVQVSKHINTWIAEVFR